MSELRAYQKKQIADLWAAWKAGYRNAFIVSPTGSGKTHVITNVIERLASTGKHIWFAVHSDTLIRQTHKKLTTVLDKIKYPVGIVQSGHPVDYQAPIQMISIDSWRSRQEKLGKPDLIIIDEAHRSVSRKWQTFLNAYPDARRVGLSASPIRLDGRGMDTGGYDVMIEGPQTKDLIEAGYLSEFKYYEFNYLTSEGAVKNRGEYNMTALGRKFDPRDYGPLIVKRFLDSELMPTLIFAMTIAHGADLIDQFSEAGIPGQWFDHTIRDKEVRQAMLDKMAENWRKLPVAGNVTLFTEGMDMPILQRTILARPTASVSLALQMWGRNLRKSVGKDYAEFWDIAGIAKEHGYPDDVRRWSLEGLVSVEDAKLIDMKTGQRTASEPGLSVIEFNVLPDGAKLALEAAQKSDEMSWWLRFLQDKLVPVKLGRAKPAMIMMAIANHTKDAPWEIWQLSIKLAVHYSRQRQDVKTLSEGWADILWKKRFGHWPKKPFGQIVRERTADNQTWLDRQKAQLLRK